MSESPHCVNCGLGLKIEDGYWIHEDDRLPCPPAFGTCAAPE